RPGRLQGHRAPVAESRTSLGLHLAARRGGQPAVELRSGHGPADRSNRRQHRGPGALPPLLQRLRAAAWRRLDVCRQVGGARRLRHLAIHGGDRRQPPPAAESALLLRVGGGVRRHHRRGKCGEWIRRPGSRYDAIGQRARVRPEPAAAVHAAVERVRGTRAHAEHVRTSRLRGAPCRSSGDAGRGQPGAARHGRSIDVGAEGHSPAARGESRYNSMQASVRQRLHRGTELMVSYTLAKGRTNNRGFYGVFGGTGLQGVTSATEGAYWQNTYDPGAEWGPAFHDVRHNLILSGVAELPFGRERRFGGSWPGAVEAILGGWGLSGIFQTRSGLPVTVVDGRLRSLQGERGSERPNCVGEWKPSDQSLTRWLDINAFATAALGTFGNC